MVKGVGLFIVHVCFSLWWGPTKLLGGNMGMHCWSVHCPCLFLSVVVSHHITPRREHGDGCWSLQ